MEAAERLWAQKANEGAVIDNSLGLASCEFQPAESVRQGGAKLQASSCLRGRSSSSPSTSRGTPALQSCDPRSNSSHSAGVPTTSFWRILMILRVSHAVSSKRFLNVSPCCRSVGKLLLVLLAEESLSLSFFLPSFLPSFLSLSLSRQHVVQDFGTRWSASATRANTGALAWL